MGFPLILAEQKPEGTKNVGTRVPVLQGNLFVFFGPVWHEDVALVVLDGADPVAGVAIVFALATVRLLSPDGNVVTVRL